MAPKIDLNADLGELEDHSLDELIMRYISSCNIASGGHAGDDSSIRRTIQIAEKHNVKIGAHPSFPDRENFGRQVIQISEEELTKSLDQQIRAVKVKAEAKGVRLHHVKPHGALYNQMASEEEIAARVIKTIKAVDDDLMLYGLAHSVTEKVANELNIPFVGEAFVDRRYEPSGQLRDRKHPDAVLHGKEVLDQVLSLVFSKQAKSGEKLIPIEAQTLCLHSDTEGAVNLAKLIYEELVSKDVHITSV